jgi:hypothetical protein
MGEIKITLAVQPRVLPNDLNPDGAEQLAVGGFDHLKFSQARLQFIGGQKHGPPERFETFPVVGGRPPDAEVG